MKLIFITFLFSNFVLTQSKLHCLVIQFESNSSELSISAQNQMKDFLMRVKNNDILIQKITGYCDTVGSLAFNKKLAQRRINSITLLLKNYENQTFTTVTPGEIYPRNTFNHTDLAFWRRVEIYYEDTSEKSLAESEKPKELNQFASLDLNSIDLVNFVPIVLKINFVPGLAELLGNSMDEINHLFNFMKENPKVFAFIRGHVCCGSDYDLSYARAKVVYTILLDNGISPNRMKFAGFDNTIPKVYPEKNEFDQVQNRRVDVIFSKMY